MNDKDQRSWIEIDLKAFTDNFRALKEYLSPEQNILQVVKADAYGHGALQIAKTALENGASILGVANIEEAVCLRIQEITAPILILSPFLLSEIDQIIEYDIIPSISNIEFCHALNNRAYQRKARVPIHIKIDTGMNRNGIRFDEFKDFLEQLKDYDGLSVEGLFSHFAASEDNDEFTQNQYLRFKECINSFKSDKYKHLNRLKYIHIANSIGLLNDKYEECNLVRFGLMSYGHYMSDRYLDKVKLTPVMTYKSRISQISKVLKNESVGYNRTFIADKDMPYAIVPIGYADGYDYLLSNKSSVLIKGVLCPVIGKISMDMLAVDVSEISDIRLGDEVILLGQKIKEINASYLANLFQGSVYELLCQLGRRAKRYYYFEGNLIDDDPLQRRAFVPNDFNNDKLTNVVQQAITKRINNTDLSSMIYNDVLKEIFLDVDNEVSYRSDFKYDIEFMKGESHKAYKVKTKLRYKKVLRHDNFIVVCANDDEKLQHFFGLQNCEYRWLLDSNVELSDNMFQTNKVLINRVSLNYVLEKTKSCLVYRFNDDVVKQFVGKEVNIYIETETYYASDKHKFAVYINELTKGVEVNFRYEESLFKVETTTIFSGREKFPKVIERVCDSSINEITVKTKSKTWVLPSSGIVFSFK
jgi:alanine racemase